MENNILCVRDFIDIKTLKVTGKDADIKYLSPKSHSLQC